MDLPDKSKPVVREKKDPVIPAGSAVQTERPARRRFMDYVFAESPKAVLAGVVERTLVPQLKAAGEQAFNTFLHGMLWPGGSGPSSLMQQGTLLRGGGVVLNPGGVDYNSLSNPAVMQAAAASGSMSGPYSDLTVVSQDFAERLLASLIADLNQYRVVTVADLMEYAQLTPTDAQGNLGWYSLEGSRIVQERNGYKLMLPKPVRV